ncbi:hypothetical protein GCK72_020250 [Caenorhabditis remanei]|uniref:Uncharacterized protein n=1 Tax=Caenorhabditis remanei TaxID=31234 RepID=A0A6A5GG90_CAERE|nr:hypothetical protein GCK72_020250 [Caenorhabditis remanei]KAF1753693.1 hypothetical protein GCK72_020250 [Caenorhabditis remanei]
MSKRLPTASVKTSTDATITALQEKLSQVEKEFNKLNEQRNAQRDTLIQAFFKKDNELKEMNRLSKIGGAENEPELEKLKAQLKEKEQIIDELSKNESLLIKSFKKEHKELIKKEREKLIKLFEREYDERFLAQKRSFNQKLSKQHQELSEKLAEKNQVIKEKNVKMNEMIAEKKAALKALRREHQESIQCTKRRIEKKFARKFERFQKFHEVSRKCSLNKESVDLVSTHDGLDDDEEYFSCCEDFEEDEATTTTGSPAPNSCSNNEDLAEELAQTKKALADLELSMKSHTDWLCSYLDNNSVMISQTFFGNEISRDIEEKIEELEQQIKKSENDRDMADFMAEIQRIEHQREIDNLELRLRDAYTLRDMI